MTELCFRSLRRVTAVIVVLVAGQLAAQEIQIPAIDPVRTSFSRDELPIVQSPAGKALAKELGEYFQAAPDARQKMTFSADADSLLTKHPAVVRKLAWSAYRGGWRRKQMADDVQASKVTWKHLTMPYVLRSVGKMPERGWPVFIAMHGGGANKHVNDRSWRSMQTRYRDQPQLGGYLYVAPRAPTDAWNGFYCDDNLALTDLLIRQLHVYHDLDANRIHLIGYSHGGYGAFYQGMRMADRFAHIHASSAAVTEYDESGLNLRNTHFTFMIDESDVKYERKARCLWFDDWIKQRRGNRDDIFPVKMEMMKGFGHGRLPDQGKIKDMYPHRRNPLPKHISWFVWPTVHHMNWLYVPVPRKCVIEAQREGNFVTITAAKSEAVHVLLDERLVDLTKPVTLEVNGATQVVTPRPSLRTLCETLTARGDPEYIFSVRIPLKIEN